MLSGVAFALAAFVLTGGYRALALRFHWFDLPNARSSHRQPVPRGAGLAFALVFSTIVGWRLLATESLWLVGASLAPALAVLATGWIDDLRGLSARARLLLYLAASAVSAGLILAPAPLDWQAGVLVAVAALALLWWTNLYNFMDGINGIAALQGIFMAFALWWLSAPEEHLIAPLYPLLGAALLGYLPWNFPRAGVFMGDAGSAFLGFVLGALALWSVATGGVTLWQVLILGGVFIVDASYTLAVRMLTGQRWHEAHRAHAYQRLADRCGSHVQAVGILMAVNVMWLLPLAWLDGSAAVTGAIWVPLAWAPLCGGCVYLRAGIAQPSVEHS